MAKVDMDAMREEFDDLKSGKKSGAGKMPRVKLREGVNRFRILPPFVQGKPWRKYQVSFGVGPDKSVIVPRRQYGLEPDPFMDYIDKTASKNDKASQALLNGVGGQGGIKPKDRYIMFILDRDNEEAGAQAFETNGKVVQEIHKYFADPEYGDLTDADEGRDVNITYTPKEKTKDKFPHWEVIPRAKTSPLSADDSLKESLLAEDLFEKYRVGFPTSEQFMEVALNGGTKDFKGPWKTRIDGTPIFEDEEEGGDSGAKQEVDEAKTTSAPAVKGPSAADRIKQALKK